MFHAPNGLLQCKGGTINFRCDIIWYDMHNVDRYLHFRAKDCRRRTGSMVAKACLCLFSAVRCM